MMISEDEIDHQEQNGHNNTSIYESEPHVIDDSILNALADDDDNDRSNLAVDSSYMHDMDQPTGQVENEEDESKRKDWPSDMKTSPEPEPPKEVTGDNANYVPVSYHSNNYLTAINNRKNQSLVKMALTESFERASNEVEYALSVAPLGHDTQEENAKVAVIAVKQVLNACLNKAVRDWGSSTNNSNGSMLNSYTSGTRVAFANDMNKILNQAEDSSTSAMSSIDGKKLSSDGSDSMVDPISSESNGMTTFAAFAAVAAATDAANAAALAAGEDQIPMSRQWVAEIRSAQVSRTYPRVSYEIFVRLTVMSDLGEAPITGSCVVRRRYRDFARLHNELKTYFLNQACLFVVIPNLPPKDYLLRSRTDPNLVFHRRCALQHWLDYVCSHHLLRNSTALRQFLWQSSTSAVTERASLDTETISATARLQAQMNVRKEAVLAFHAEEAQIVALRKAFRSSAVAHLQMNALVHGLEQAYRSSAKSSRDCRHADAELLIARREVAQALKDLCDFESKHSFSNTPGNEYAFLGRFAVALGNAYDSSSGVVPSSTVSSPSQGESKGKKKIRNPKKRVTSNVNRRSKLTGSILEHDVDDEDSGSMIGGDSSDDWVAGGYSVGTTYEGFLPNPSDSRWREETNYTSGNRRGLLHEQIRDTTMSGEDDNQSLSSRISAAVKSVLFTGAPHEASAQGSTVSSTSFFPTIIEAGEISLPKTPSIHFDSLSLKRFEYMLMLWGNKLFPEVKKGFVHPSASESQRKVTIRYTDDLIENVPPPRTKTERCAAEWVELGVIRPRMIQDAAMRMVKNQIAHIIRERMRWEAIKAELEVDLKSISLNDNNSRYPL